MRIGAIEAGGTKFVCAVGNEEGEIINRISIKTETPEKTMQQVTEYFKSYELDCIGLGCFGPIDLNENSDTYGFITSTPKLAWANYNIVGELKKHFDLPIAFDTDVNGAALGEVMFGSSPDLSSVVYMTIGTGIGAGALIDGKLVHGILHPEMGHMFVKRHPTDQFKGTCPYHGDCLEGLAAGPAIEQRWNTKGEDLVGTHKAWELEAFYIASGLVNIMTILSPERIILGGGVSKQNHLIEKVRKQFTELSNSYIKAEQLDEMDEYIVYASLGDDAGIKGAIALAIRLMNK
jgi:fructokinase